MYLKDKRANMGQHDKYGKELLKDINNSSQDKKYCQFKYGNYGTANIDGVIIRLLAKLNPVILQVSHR